jgi:formylglycine-generating enzyme required for sulfatase activity
MKIPPSLSALLLAAAVWLLPSATTHAATVTVDSASVTVDTRDAVNLTSQPTNATANPGASASFSVTAAGGGPYTYQWKKNGTSISGATGATLSLSNVQPTDAASYTVVVTGMGSVTSDAASLTVVPTAWMLFSAAESAFAVADVGLVNLSPIEKLSVVTGAAAHSGSGNALKFQTVDNGSTFAERTIVGPAVVDFWWRVSSEEGADFFNYSVDGTIQQSISGNGSWANRSLALGAGTHTLRWTYAKDVDSANFDDAGYLDDLVILPAYTDLQVSRLGTVLSGSSTLDFGTVQQEAAEVTQELDLKNNGTAPMEVAASLPDGCGFVFDTDEASIVFTLGAGEETIVSLKLQTAVAGAKSALLAIEGTDSQTAAPAITLSGHVQAIAPILGCSWSGGALTNGQNTAVDFGATPSDRVFTISNTGQAALTIASLSVSPTTDFQVIAQPAASVAVNGSTTFTLRALEGGRGSHSATVTIASNDGSAPNFSFPVTSESYLAATGTSFVSGSFTNTGTSAGWSNAAVTLASGSSGQALKTGTTPDNGSSTIGATFDGPGLLSWNWQVSSQANYDWLLCEVNGVEVAGISTKTAAWQSQVVQIPAGAQVRWIYRKDGSNFSGSDTGYLSDIYFSKFAAVPTSFSVWSAANGNLAPAQLIPAGGMQAMFAWLGGVNPATGPAAGQFKSSVSGGFYKYRYTVAKAAAGIVQPQISTDLAAWNSRRMKQTLISEDSTSAVVELSMPATGKVFSRIATETPAYSVPAPAGFVTVMAGVLPSSSPLGEQSVATFYMAQTETTWGQWQTVRTWAAAHGYDLNGVGAGNGDSYPVTDVSWYHVVKWCNARSEMEGLTPVYTVNGAFYRTGDSAPDVNASANGYRLPGEAEWEFAARGGVNTHGYEYSGSNDLNAVAWFGGNSGYTTHSVATKLANELGLSDMSGNVWEWCYDWYPGYEGSVRVTRGGSWNYSAYYCRVAFRNVNYPSFTSSYVGFRVARSSVPQ